MLYFNGSCINCICANPQKVEQQRDSSVKSRRCMLLVCSSLHGSKYPILVLSVDNRGRWALVGQEYRNCLPEVPLS